MSPAPRFFPTTGHLLLCQGPHCLARQSAALLQALQSELEREALMYYQAGGSLRLSASGCLGACAAGPVLACYRTRQAQLEEGWYASAGLPLARQVARAVHEESDWPPGRYGP